MDINNEKTIDSDLPGEAASFKMIDTFRFFHKDVENVFTCWNTMINARSTNYGSRIDYIFVDTQLIKSMTDSIVLSEIHGSDHCPIAGIFDFEPVKSLKCPSTCIKYFPEFSGVQQKLSAFFVKTSEMPSDFKGVHKSSSDMNNQSKKRKNVEANAKDCSSKVTFKKSRSLGNSSQKQISSFFQRAQHPVDEDFVSSSQDSSSSISDGCGLAGGSSQDIESESEKVVKSVIAASAWRNMLTGPRPPPLCKGHKEPCVERTVKKKGPNFSRKFFACARGDGSKTDPRARCDHFEWAVKK